MQQRHGYSKAVLGITGCAASQTLPLKVRKTLWRRHLPGTLASENPPTGRMSGGVAMPSRITGELPPRRAAAPGYADCPKPEAERVC